MRKNWVEGKLDSENILLKLLSNRGVLTDEKIQSFLNPKSAKLLSPYLFKDMERAINRVKRAIEDGEHILIWGDFDADGVSSSALLYKTLKELGANFSHFIPNREEHGHGLNLAELVKIISKKKLKLLITVDCGISDNAIISTLKGFKVDTIITDHHKQEGELPDAYAILNPSAQGAIIESATASEIQSLCDLAGVGVAYKFASALVDEPDLALVALGTIADVVPLLGENRTLVALGLEKMQEHKGISKLFSSLNYEGEITSDAVAFLLSPRINAVGRLASVEDAFNLLVSDCEMTLETSIQKLDNYNSIRQTLCDETFNECLKKLDSAQNAIMLCDENWHLGVIGIVASRLVDVFNKPVFLATKNEKGEGRCSIRSIEPYNVYNILKENSELFLGFGGHSLAGGFSFERDFDEIKTKLLNSIQKEIPINNLYIDFELQSEQINENLINDINKLEPFGQGNRSPLFSIKNATLLNYRQIGKDGSHLRFEIEKDGYVFKCLWWKKQNFSLKIGSKLDVAFSPKLNVFNGETSVQLEVVDIKSDELEVKIYDHRAKNLDEILDKINDYVKNKQVLVLAKTLSTLDVLAPHKALLDSVNNTTYDEVMIFDYPNSLDEISCFSSGFSKLHLMPEKLEKNANYYLDSVFKMLKFAHNKKDGVIDLSKMALLLGLSVEILKIILEYFSSVSAISYDGGVKISVLKNSFEIDENNEIYEAILDELNSIFAHKTSINSSDVENFKAYL